MSLYTKMKEKNQAKKNMDSGYMSESDYDLDLLAKIQPRGGVNYKNDFYVKGTGYETCITIYETPTDVEDFG